MLENAPTECFDGSVLESLLSRDTVFPDLDSCDFPGRIGRPNHFSFWRDVLKADKEILSIFCNGYFELIFSLRMVAL